MSTRIEVFADITCPFTYVGLNQLVELLDLPRPSVSIHVRAWPLEWVNASALESSGVAVKIQALETQLGVNHFSGFSEDRWPNTTISALNLVAQAYDQSSELGFEISMLVRRVLFEEGLNIADPQVLDQIARANGLSAPSVEATKAIVDDYHEGQKRAVVGSPHFWIGSDDYFCPLLDVGHDSSGKLTAGFDDTGLAEFTSRIGQTR